MNDNELLAYYETLHTMTPAMLEGLWQEETQEQCFEMLGAVPPLAAKEGAFLVGECVTHNVRGPIYDAHIEIDGKYFWRPALVQSFNPANYRAEVRVKFYGQCHSCGYPLDLNGMCTAPLQGDD